MLLSVVVPVHGVAPYLAECLDSILCHDGDLDVVAVDDASPDGCGELLDAYVRRDARVRVEHLHRNVGLGLARGVGFELAKGEYVWFVDGDDRLLDGALAAVSAAVESRPDMLLVDYGRDSWQAGGGRSNLDAVLPPATTPPVFTVESRPGAFGFLHTAWSRVLHRDLVARAGFPFHPGWYEDVSFTYPLLVAAQRIAVLRQPAYQYRDLRADAITRTVHERHFDVFDQYERLFATLDRWGVDAFAADPATDVRRHLFDRMIWHYGRILGDPQRVPPQRQRAFFARMSEHHQRFRPGGTAPPRRTVRDALKHRLIAGDAWRTYATLRATRRLARLR